MRTTKIIQVFGRVQNVGFRFATIQKAKELNLTGFVKNMPDSSVYIEAQGDEIALEQFLLWCNQGPNWARVDRVQVIEAQASEYLDFTKK